MKKIFKTELANLIADIIPYQPAIIVEEQDASPYKNKKEYIKNFYEGLIKQLEEMTDRDTYQSDNEKKYLQELLDKAKEEEETYDDDSDDDEDNSFQAYSISMIFFDPCTSQKYEQLYDFYEKYYLNHVFMDVYDALDGLSESFMGVYNYITDNFREDITTYIKELSHIVDGDIVELQRLLQIHFDDIIEECLQDDKYVNLVEEAFIDIAARCLSAVTVVQSNRDCMKDKKISETPDSKIMRIYRSRTDVPGCMYSFPNGL